MHKYKDLKKFKDWFFVFSPSQPQVVNEQYFLSDDVARLQEILPNTCTNNIVNALSNTVTASDAVTLLISDKNDSSSNDGINSFP